MPALFPKWADQAFRLVLTALVIVPVGGFLALMLWVRSPLGTGETAAVRQPVPFDHRIHVRGLAIDCRYCHAGADRAPVAGLPPTVACVPCHTQAWLSSSTFAPVRASLGSGRPIPWRRVNWLPAFVYFDHAVHTTKGVGCETCHRRVDLMPTVRQATPLTMNWCVSCHANPEPHLRPLDQITTMGWQPPNGPARLAALPGPPPRPSTTCTACHR